MDRSRTWLSLGTALAALAAALTGCAGNGDEPAAEDAALTDTHRGGGLDDAMPTADALVSVMDAKLYHSKLALESIVLEEWEALEEHAEALERFSREADWFVHKTEAYYAQSDLFRDRVEALGNAAATRDVDAAISAYREVTLSCVDCHRYLRQSGLYVPGRVTWQGDASADRG